MTYIDTHIHLDGEEFDADRDETVSRAREAGCAAMLVPAIDMEHLPALTEICSRYPGYAYPMIGLHPEEVRPDWREVLASMKRMIQPSSPFIAIGEKGHNLKSYYVGHRKLQSFKACIEQMRDVICPGLDLAFGEYPDTTDINYGMVNLNALHDDTGFSCKADFSESILRTAAWLASTLHEEDLRPELMSQGLRAKLEESLGGGQPSSIRHLTPVALKWMVA